MIFEKQIDKLVDRALSGSKKDQRIKELWNALNHAYSTIETYGSHMDDYEANPNWQPPPYLRKHEWTNEDRLEKIRYHSRVLRECAEDIHKVLFKGY